MDSSDSEDDAQLQQFREAADPTLFTNAMYQKSTASTEKDVNGEANAAPIVETNTVQVTAKAKSQRYLPEDEADFSAAADMQVPEMVREHMAKKLKALLDQHIEFKTLNAESQKETNEKRHKSRVLLLHDADCYLRTDDELGDVAAKGPQIKPIIKRRRIGDDGDDAFEHDEAAKLLAAAVTPADIAHEAAHWAVKRERADKVFHYKAKHNGVLHAVVPTNEFTQMRKKNQWSEEKIKRKLRKT